MDARSYERLYGLRFMFMLFAVLLLGFCLFMSSGLLFKGLGAGEVHGEKETPTQPVLVFPTSLGSPTSDVSPTVAPFPSPTTQPSATLEPIATPGASPTPIVLPTSTFSSEMVVCTGIQNGYLNFRMLPGGSVIDWLSEGTRVTFIEKADALLPWYMIEVEGVQGYAYGKYLCNP